MKIKIEAVNVESGARRELGTCLTNSPTRAIQAYENRLNEYERLEWEDITNKAASALGKSRAGKPAAVAASRENGKKGGRPRKEEGK
jgi:pyruvate/oxaloacetate carboxyltransferase